jgi:hypothetical protein
MDWLSLEQWLDQEEMMEEAVTLLETKLDWMRL